MEKNLEICSCGHEKEKHGETLICNAFISAGKPCNCKAFFRPAPSQPSMTSYTTKQVLERDEKIARIVKEFRKLWNLQKKTYGTNDNSEENIEDWLEQTLTTLLNEE